MAYRRRYANGPRKYMRHGRRKTPESYVPPELLPPSRHVRRQTRCRRCGMNTGVYFCRMDHETAWYHCANGACSARFMGERPLPMEMT